MDSLDHQVSYWNVVGSIEAFGHRLNIDRLRGEVSPDGRILDFGCGYGRLTAGFQQVALDEMMVQTMNGHPAKAFQWFGRKKPAGGLTTA